MAVNLTHSIHKFVCFVALLLGYSYLSLRSLLNSFLLSHTQVSDYCVVRNWLPGRLLLVNQWRHFFINVKQSFIFIFFQIIK